MVRVIALAGLVVVSLAAYLLLRPANPSQAELQITNRYLLVSIEGPTEWSDQHRIFIQWKGKDVPLPVVFRVAGAAENIHLGAAPEFEKSLVIGKDKIAVQVEPATKFRVSNEIAVSFMPEPGSRPGVSAMSIATWVTVSPSDQPGKTNPMAGNDEFQAAGKTVAAEVKKLLAAGKVIDVVPEE